MTKTETLLRDREIRGLQISFYTKSFFFFWMVYGAFSPAATWIEKVFSSTLTVLFIIATGILLLLLKRTKNPVRIGVTGALLDVGLVGVFPVIWYMSVGGDAVSPAYLLKTMAPIFVSVVLALSSLAGRPLYPVIVGIGYALTQVAFYMYAAQDERLVVTHDFVEAILGETVNYTLFWFGDILMPLAVAMTLSILTFMFRRSVHEAVHLEKAKGQMQRYFTPAVAEKIAVADDDFLKPGGHRQDVAVMFCDIRGFTSLSEKLSPEEVLDLLSEYHARMVDVIFRLGGSLDKFMGDGIMATFGTPETAPDDAERAVRAGIAMKKELQELNIAREKRGLPALHQGIGIHHGSVIAGNIGTSERLEYTVIGDTVNVASRIESACKELGETFLISETVRARMSDDIHTRDLGTVAVKGKAEPISVFAVDF